MDCRQTISPGARMGMAVKVALGNDASRLWKGTHPPSILSVCLSRMPTVERHAPRRSTTRRPAGSRRGDQATSTFRLSIGCAWCLLALWVGYNWRPGTGMYDEKTAGVWGHSSRRGHARCRVCVKVVAQRSAAGKDRTRWLAQQALQCAMSVQSSLQSMSPRTLLRYVQSLYSADIHVMQQVSRTRGLETGGKKD
ncbi:uncharacterized protein F5Z01DRAFT_132893 [Emericellopsis atlantica]|uniref:Uncharacterized protein n=1 Tax=Emericellopsis atlantica TaxID=2614577 RepID=A0A9P8CNU6_9HYPO|nr:uncharacterized protein F5Z01DRAFT_132893 [Emericellopsis atlantica]KAG9253873.1 hypothetical protein F5Z01DRAFT_132893 [Emericellopsis atlantica]